MAFTAGSGSQDAVEIAIPLVFIQGRKCEPVVGGNAFQEIGELFTKWGREPLSRVGGLAFGVLDLNRHLLKIDSLKGDASFSKATPEVDEQLKGDSHPCPISFFGGEARTSRLNFFVRQLSLILRGGELNSMNRNHIAVAKLSSDRLVQEEAEKFQLHSGCIVTGRPSNGGFSPAEILLGVPVANVAGVGQAMFVQEYMNRAPEIHRAAASLKVGVVSRNIVGHPIGKGLTLAGWPRNGFFLALFGDLLQGSGRVLRAVVAELQVLGLPLSRIQVAIAKMVVGGARFLDQVRHESLVAHSGTRHKGFKSF